MNQIAAILVGLGWPTTAAASTGACSVFSSDVAAAWLQAVGSVVAILVAAWLPGRQRRRELAEARQTAQGALRQAAKVLRSVAGGVRKADSPAALTDAAKDGARPLGLVKVAVESHVASTAHHPGLQEAILLAVYRLDNAIGDLTSIVAPVSSRLEAERDRLAKGLEEDADAIAGSA